MADRKTVPCPHCGAGAGEPCDFGEDPAPWVTDVDGGRRRAVHAARYAETLPEPERAAFWEAAVEDYVSSRLAEIDEGSES